MQRGFGAEFVRPSGTGACYAPNPGFRPLARTAPWAISLLPPGAGVSETLLNHPALAVLDEAGQQCYVFAFEFFDLFEGLRGVEL